MKKASSKDRFLGSHLGTDFFCFFLNFNISSSSFHYVLPPYSLYPSVTLVDGYLLAIHRNFLVFWRVTFLWKQALLEYISCWSISSFKGKHSLFAPEQSEWWEGLVASTTGEQEAIALVRLKVASSGTAGVGTPGNTWTIHVHWGVTAGEAFGGQKQGTGFLLSLTDR